MAAPWYSAKALKDLLHSYLESLCSQTAGRGYRSNSDALPSKTFPPALTPWCRYTDDTLQAVQHT